MGRAHRSDCVGHGSRGAQCCWWSSTASPDAGERRRRHIVARAGAEAAAPEVRAGCREPQYREANNRRVNCAIRGGVGSSGGDPLVAPRRGSDELLFLLSSVGPPVRPFSVVAGKSFIALTAQGDGVRRRALSDGDELLDLEMIGGL